MVVGDFALERDTVVIGSGPGGYVAAIRAAEMGQKVTIIERDKIGGVCLNVGCIPSKALINAGHRYQETLDGKPFGVSAKNVTIDFSLTQKWKDEQVVKTLTNGVAALLKKHKVEIVKGEALFNDDRTIRVVTDESAQSYTFNHAIIATGSRPVAIKGFPYGKRVLDSTGALALKEVPKHLVVIGGGYIGCELAGAYMNLGAKVTILEGTASILPNFEPEMVQMVVKNYKAKGVEIITNAQAQNAVEHEDRVSVTYNVADGQHTIDADYVLVSVGRRPNTDELGLEMAGVDVLERGLIKVDEKGQTTNPHIYAIGDVVPGLALAHKASYEAKIAAEAISGKKVRVDYKAIPAVCFTTPELAIVGLSEKEAKAQNINFKASKFPYAANGRALSLAQREGYVKLITEAESGLLIGAQVAGVNASDIISELTLAIEAGMNVEDIALTIHAHPTLAEMTMDAAELALGLPIHI